MKHKNPKQSRPSMNEKSVKHNVNEDDVMICADSHSLVQALSNNSPDTATTRWVLDNSQANVTIQWIPGHELIAGNEFADRLAKDGATNTLDDASPISLKSAISCIRRTFKDPAPMHHRISKVYTHYSKTKDKEAIKTRKDAVLLARLRSGHSLAFGVYRNLMDATENPDCPRCSQDKDTVEHWISCPGTAAARQIIFGSDRQELDIMTKDPSGTIALARETLRC